MDPEPLPGDWNWEDPDEFSRRRAEADAELVRCRSLEVVAEATPRVTARQLARLGITGIEFGALRTGHPAGLAADSLHLSDGRTHTEAGRIYRVDGARHFSPVDICHPLALDTGCLDWVYAEHLVEHVRLPAAIRWLREVRRALRRGALVRLTTPDLSRYAHCYANGGSFFAEHRRRIDDAVKARRGMPIRPAFMFNQLFYLYGHQWIYDEVELRYALTSAGFDDRQIAVYGFRQGARPDVAQLDKHLRNDETIYIEAIA